jgi:hypothetical protein
MVPILWVIGVLGTYTVVQRMIEAHRQMSRMAAESRRTGAPEANSQHTPSPNGGGNGAAKNHE